MTTEKITNVSLLELVLVLLGPDPELSLPALGVPLPGPASGFLPPAVFIVCVCL